MDAPHALAGRVSRRELALDRRIWLAQAAMFGVLAVSSVALAVGPFGFEAVRLLGLAAGLALVSITLLLTSPQPIDSPGNHLAVASTYVGTSAAMFAFAPQTVAVVAAIMFAGPLAAVRLVDRGQITGHLVLATASVVAPAIYAHATAQGIVGMATLVIGVWVLGGCCVFVLETAEAQGEELEQLVRRDPLTGVGNRRMFTEQLGRGLRRHQRTRRPLSVLSIGLDGFKDLNDTRGHAAGDALLQRVAAALVGAVPPRAVVTRPGGDEFWILLPDTSPEDARGIAEAVRAGLVQCRATAGIGVASFPRDAVHDKILMHLADQRQRDDKAAHGRGGSAEAAASPLRVLPDDRRSA